MIKRCSTAKPYGIAKLPDKRLVCNKKSEDGSSKANLEDAPGDNVWGVLYEMDSPELNILDKREKGYDRISLNVLADDELSLEAYVYISSKLTSDPRPYNSYKELMINGAIEHKLPSCYIEFLKQIDSKSDTGNV
jgi:gamma-glutamylcyclotransferase